jgi:beta-lactamase regulating signal transducer with metallopeptidase domain
MSCTCCGPTFFDLCGIVLVHATWQAASIACLIALLGSLSRSPRHFSNWCLLALFFCPMLMIGTLICLMKNWLPLNPGILVTNFMGIAVAGWLSRLWLIGISIAAILWIAAWLRVIRLCRQPQLPVPASWQLTCTPGAVQVRVIDTNLISGPVTVGWRRPVILVPQHCIETLTAEQAKLLLEHEKAHIVRGDFFWNVLQSVVELLLFFHPTVWLLSRWIRSEREFACDDIVLAYGANPKLYARTLAQLAQHDRWLQSSLVAAYGPPIRTRIERLLKAKTPPRIQRWQHSLSWLILLVGLGYALPGVTETQANQDHAPGEPAHAPSSAQILSLNCCPT